MRETTLLPVIFKADKVKPYCMYSMEHISIQSFQRKEQCTILTGYKVKNGYQVL